MEAKLQKWGNSVGIRIPNVMLKELDLKNNDKVNLEQVEDRIIITKSKKDKVSLKKLFDNYVGENLPKVFEWMED